jgi:hypothetical protein
VCFFGDWQLLARISIFGRLKIVCRRLAIEPHPPYFSQQSCHALNRPSMPAPKHSRRYPLSDAALKQRGDALLNCMERDADFFATRNIGTAEMNGLKDLLEEFADLPDEVENRGLLTAAVEKREELAQQLRRQIASIRNIAAGTYGNAGAYRRFGFAYMHKLDENGLHRLGRRVVSIGTELLSELSAKGLTQEMLDALEALNNAFDDAIEVVHQTNVAGELDTEVRIKKGNAIWTTMASFALAGKGLFQDTDAARFRHYVLED